MINIKIILLLSLAAYEECGGGNLLTRFFTKKSLADANSEDGESIGYHSANEVPTYDKEIGTVTTLYNIEDAVHYLGDNVTVEFKGEALFINGKEIQGVTPGTLQKSREEGVDRREMEISSYPASRNYPFTDFCVVQFNNDTLDVINQEPERKILTFIGDTLSIDGKKVPGVNARKRPLLIEWGDGVLKIDGTLNGEFGPIHGRGFWECL
ncbi:uncharacterized protein LOC126841246 [Adelges cooleyi]|uniref:uncharacterized protein LOC126841246 n=1 Tax=Adelges cooleyi TaxID=133065 RepID=UPI00217FF84A|nr:uncharacterized protein LOC126841246 [Adelges cooleyi]